MVSWSQSDNQDNRNVKLVFYNYNRDERSSHISTGGQSKYPAFSYASYTLKPRQGGYFHITTVLTNTFPPSEAPSVTSCDLQQRQVFQV